MFPYDSIPDQQNWRRAVTRVDRHAVDPQSGARFRLSRETTIASAGSCFASRISESLRQRGFNYYLAEPGPPFLSREDRLRYNYGVYSARYGNVYTTLQLLQLLRRSLGTFEPLERSWRSDRGAWLDPFRPAIAPDGFLSESELENDRRQHLAAVKTMLSEVDVLIFTLGLTEVWCDRRDGAAFPTCPGRGQGEFDAQRHVFHNIGFSENVAHLSAFLDALVELNPKIKVLLTVSPVPLAATMENAHVLAATTYSKSVLRVAAEEMRRKYDFVDYFASYEIITGTGNALEYYEGDRRTVTGAGVDHVMASFYRHYAGTEIDSLPVTEVDSGEFIVEGKPCDEDLLLSYLEADKSASAAR
jgi:hypothetical protein